MCVCVSVKEVISLSSNSKQYTAMRFNFFIYIYTFIIQLPIFLAIELTFYNSKQTIRAKQ